MRWSESLPVILGRDVWEKTREMLWNLKMIIDGCESKTDLRRLAQMYPLVSCMRTHQRDKKDEDEDVFAIMPRLRARLKWNSSSIYWPSRIYIF